MELRDRSARYIACDPMAASGQVNVTRHGAHGPRAEGLRPGDFILVHSYGQVAPRLIGFGQKLHHPREFAYWTHAALYVGDLLIGDWPCAPDGDPSRGPWLIEAKGKHPVRCVPLSQYDIRDYAAVRFDLGDESSYEETATYLRHNAVAYARSQLGHGYGYWTIATLSVWAVFGGRLTVGISGENVCSGLVASALTRLGELFDGDPVTQMPADLARKYEVRR